MHATPSAEPRGAAAPIGVAMRAARPSAPRHLFLYFCAMASLYMGTINLGGVLFHLIDAALPDALDPEPMDAGALRWSVASLLVIFPLFVWASRTILRERLADPAAGESRVRQWLVHLTIFLGGAVLVGDLIALVFNLLEGELTARFMLKVGVVLVIAGAVFGYYLQDLRRPARALVPLARTAAAAVSVLVMASVAAGIVTSGSPFRQRLARLDAQKVRDLRELQDHIVSYWRHKELLPASLDALNDPLSGFQIPTDPQSGKPYEYRVTGATSFEVCADFNGAGKGMPADPSAGRRRLDESWKHGPGRQCFARFIDPELYPPLREEAAK